MDPFPDDWELLAYFEMEPRLIDPNIPWAYNHLMFESIRGADHIHCVMEPGYEQFAFTWSHNGKRHLSLKLYGVAGMSISTGGGRDAMVLTFRDPFVEALRLQLKPTIECDWGTTRELP